MKVEQGHNFRKGSELVDQLRNIMHDLMNPIDEDGIDYFRDLLVDLEKGDVITESQYDEFYREISEGGRSAWYDVEEFNDDGVGL